MGTCANCIHHSLCDYNTNISGNGKVRLVYSDGADVKCSFFQNTADVVPKSEVAEIIEETFKSIRENFVNTPICKVALSDLEAELKKKYTESENG